MPHTRITILCENRAHMAKDIMGEHGFAALRKTPATSLLMDTGQQANEHLLLTSADNHPIIKQYRVKYG